MGPERATIITSDVARDRGKTIREVLPVSAASVAEGNEQRRAARLEASTAASTPPPADSAEPSGEEASE